MKVRIKLEELNGTLYNSQDGCIIVEAEPIEERPECPIWESRFDEVFGIRQHGQVTHYSFNGDRLRDFIRTEVLTRFAEECMERLRDYDLSEQFNCEIHSVLKRWMGGI